MDINNNEKTYIASNQLENASDPVASLNENWCDLDNIHSKKPNYLDPCSDWDYVQRIKFIYQYLKMASLQ